MSKSNTFERIKQYVFKCQNKVKELEYLPEDDANKLIGYFNYLNDRTDKNSKNLCATINKLLRKRKSNEKEINFTDEECSYIKHELSSLPFLYANIDESYRRRFGENRVKFYYSVDNIIRILEVFPDKILRYDIDPIGNKVLIMTGLNNAQYVKEKEKISYKDALRVILGVYDPSYAVDDQALLPIIQKYKDALVSDQFEEFLNLGIERVISSNLGKDVDLSFYDNMKTVRKRLKGDKGPSKIKE